MSYTYDRRKRPQGQQAGEPERTTAPGPGMEAPMSGRAAPGPAAQDRSFDLDAAMRERMTNTFGDLSALRDWQPPVREAAPAQAGPYTGPVTHALSGASPSHAAAGLMQAKRRDADAREVRKLQEKGKDRSYFFALPGSKDYDKLSEKFWNTKVHTPNWFSRRILGKKDQEYKVRRNKAEEEWKTYNPKYMDMIDAQNDKDDARQYSAEDWQNYDLADDPDLDWITPLRHGSAVPPLPKGEARALRKPTAAIIIPTFPRFSSCNLPQVLVI